MKLTKQETKEELDAGFPVLDTKARRSITFRDGVYTVMTLYTVNIKTKSFDEAWEEFKGAAK